MKDRLTMKGRTQSAPDHDATLADVGDRVQSIVLEAGTALAAVIAALPDPIRRAADLERALNLQAPLAWRVFRMSQAAEAAEIIEHLPTLKQLERVVKEASARVPVPVAERAAAAVASLTAIVQELGGDQRGFESLASGLTPEGVRRVEIDHRRLAFRGNAHLWGLQARCLSACAIERPGSAPRTRDILSIRSLVDLQVQRPDVPVRIQASFNAAGGKLLRGTAGSSVEPEIRSELRLLPPTHPERAGTKLPELLTEQTPDGWQLTQVVVPGIGRKEAVSFHLFQSIMGIEDDGSPGIGMLVEIPAEYLKLDYIVPHGWLSPETARARVFANRHDIKSAYHLRSSDRLPQHEEVEFYPKRETAPVSREVPHWPEVVRQVLKEAGWSGVKYDVYRCLIPFPMLHAWSGLLVDRAAASASDHS